MDTVKEKVKRLHTNLAFVNNNTLKWSLFYLASYCPLQVYVNKMIKKRNVHKIGGQLMSKWKKKVSK